jgi:DNA-binding NarL/FixJ family response regulator
MDVSMPVMDGIEATRVIVAELPGVQVVGLSMHAEAEGAEAMRQAGTVNYVSKGGPPKDLLAIIHRVRK